MDLEIILNFCDNLGFVSIDQTSEYFLRIPIMALIQTFLNLSELNLYPLRLVVCKMQTQY